MLWPKLTELLINTVKFRGPPKGPRDKVKRSMKISSFNRGKRLDRGLLSVTEAPTVRHQQQPERRNSVPDQAEQLLIGESLNKTTKKVRHQAIYGLKVPIWRVSRAIFPVG